MTANEVFQRLFFCVLILGFAYYVNRAIEEWWQGKKWREYRERATKIRNDIGEGRYSRFPAQEVFEEMMQLLVDLVAEVTHLSNELLQKRHPRGRQGTLDEPIVEAEKTIDGIWERLVGQPNLVDVATTAFILQETARQIEGLRRGDRYLSPVDFLSLLDQADRIAGERVGECDMGIYPNEMRRLCSAFYRIRNGWWTVEREFPSDSRSYAPKRELFGETPRRPEFVGRRGRPRHKRAERFDDCRDD